MSNVKPYCGITALSQFQTNILCPATNNNDGQAEKYQVLYRSQAPFQISNQIFQVLDPHRQAHQRVIDTE